MLIKYEFLKIIRRKSTLMIMCVSLLVTGLLFTLPVLQFQINDRETVIRGLRGINYEKEQYSDLSVTLTEDYIADTIREYQRLFENPDNVGYDGNERFLIGDAYWNFASPRRKLLGMIGKNYDNPGENSGWDKLAEMDVTEGAGFYERRDEKMEILLNTPSRQLSDSQKKYWSDMASHVKTPFQYGYYEGWNVIITSFELLMFPLLAVCIVLAPVFSGEYQAGTDAVILSGKYGKTKLIKAKILASLIFGMLAFTLHIIVAFAIPLLAFGTEGWNLPVQLGSTVIPYPLTFMEAAFINLAVIYFILLAMISLTLLLSAKMKSSYHVLMVLVPVIFISLFLSPNGTTGLYNQIMFLLPYRASMPELSNYVSYSFGHFVLDVFSMRVIVYGILAAVMIPLAGIGFKKHQV